MESDGFITFKQVEARLAEAFDTLRALPDREAGWLGVRTMGLWREVLREEGDWLETTPARLGVRKLAFAEMQEALGWCDWLPAEARRIVGRVFATRRADDTQIDWPAVRGALIRAPGGAQYTKITTDAVRKRYSRALNVICARLNAAIF